MKKIIDTVCDFMETETGKFLGLAIDLLLIVLLTISILGA